MPFSLFLCKNIVFKQFLYRKNHIRNKLALSALQVSYPYNSRVRINDKISVRVARQTVNDSPGISGVSVRRSNGQNNRTHWIIFVDDSGHGSGKNGRHVLHVVDGEDELALDREVAVVNSERQSGINFIFLWRLYQKDFTFY